VTLSEQQNLVKKLIIDTDTGIFYHFTKPLALQIPQKEVQILFKLALKYFKNLPSNGFSKKT
jgi:hypothetical protein